MCSWNRSDGAERVFGGEQSHRARAPKAGARVGPDRACRAQADRCDPDARPRIGSDAVPAETRITAESTTRHAAAAHDPAAWGGSSSYDPCDATRAFRGGRDGSDARTSPAIRRRRDPLAAHAARLQAPVRLDDAREA